MKKTLILIVLAVLTGMSMSAQMVIKNDGRIIVGPNTNPNDDLDYILTMAIHGSGDYFAGSKLGFGDMGRQSLNGLNVFVGEYGTTDSDRLWLHGKNGIVMTNGNGTTVVGSYGYQANASPRFTFYDGVRMDRLFVSSVDNHKRSVGEIQNALPRLMQLNGIRYNYRPVNNIVPDVSMVSPIETDSLSDRERADIAQMESLLSLRDQGDIRYGLMASDIASVFPELVERDSVGNEYVNYLELIPIMISAFKELYSTLEENGIRLDAEGHNDYMNSPYSDSTSRMAYGREYGIQGTADNGAKLYQNTPNPFSNTTVIKYFVPNNVSQADLFIFNLNGELLQTYPLNTFGNGQIMIDGSTFNAGMYVYSLVVDNQIMDTKRMILTK